MVTTPPTAQQQSYSAKTWSLGLARLLTASRAIVKAEQTASPKNLVPTFLILTTLGLFLKVIAGYIKRMVSIVRVDLWVWAGPRAFYRQVWASPSE